MRAFVFGEAQIEPALQRWFGSQQLTTEEEIAFKDRVMEFLCSTEASALRYTNHDPKPEGAAPNG